jgi:hypothetical protein|uniref:Uncharacterized protein n=1 Tax=Desulfobacca acetoxidans TaxID=60893 RepID=A0A7V6A6M4_9BACT
MRKKVFLWLPLGCLLILSLALLGCGGGAGKGLMAGPQYRQTQSKTDLLLAAGFKQIFPTTPQLKERLNAMPQHQLFMASQGPKIFYVYADAEHCGCFYAGTPDQYQAYKRLAAQARIAAEELQAARINQSMNWGWDEWGEAGPWAY